MSEAHQEMFARLFALSGAASFEMATEAFPTLNPSIVETCTIRNRTASDVLAAALK